MNRQEIDKAIHSLAMSQGFYGRVLRGNYGNYEAILDWLEDEIKPKELLDIVYAFEC